MVVHAIADRAATGLKQKLDIVPDERPIIGWNWRVVRLISGADNTDRNSEDAPVRLMLFFDGDVRHLPAREQIKMETARVLSGQPVPYATLMYIWENKQPVGKVIPNAHTARVRMVVAGSGTDRLGQWKQFERNYVEDFHRAFKEARGRLVGVGYPDRHRQHGRKRRGVLRGHRAAPRRPLTAQLSWTIPVSSPTSNAARPASATRPDGCTPSRAPASRCWCATTSPACAQALPRDDARAARAPTLWRYRELLPVPRAAHACRWARR